MRQESLSIHVDVTDALTPSSGDLTNLFEITTLYGASGDFDIGIGGAGNSNCNCNCNCSNSNEGSDTQ